MVVSQPSIIKVNDSSFRSCWAVALFLFGVRRGISVLNLVGSPQ